MDSEPRRQPGPDDEEKLLAQLARLRGTVMDHQAIIRRQRALLDECETLIDAMRQEIQNLGGSLEGIITADELLSRLRAQEKVP